MCNQVVRVNGAAGVMIHDAERLMMRLIDLTQTLRRGMRGVDWEESRTVIQDGWNARMLHLYSHSGTHMDAQTHFAAGTQTIDQIPLSACLGAAVVADVLNLQPGDLITLGHLGSLPRSFRRGDCLLLRTGWSKYIDQPAMYRDGLPRISEDLARWCVAAGVNVLGVEPPSVADINCLDELTRIHQILLSGRVTIVEGLTNLQQLSEPRFFFAALPLRIEGGDGCPCRAFAVEGDAAGISAAMFGQLLGESDQPHSEHGE